MKKIFCKVFFCFVIIVLSSIFLMSCGKSATNPDRITDNNISENTENIEKYDGAINDGTNTVLNMMLSLRLTAKNLKLKILDIIFITMLLYKCIKRTVIPQRMLQHLIGLKQIKMGKHYVM